VVVAAISQRAKMTIHIKDKTELAALQKKLGVKSMKQRRPSRELEHAEQVKVITWAKRMECTVPALALLFSIPNGGQRSKATAGKLKAEGVKAGVSDLFLALPARGYHGIFLEMKAKDGRLSELQMNFLEDVSDQGYCAAVGYGADRGIEILEWYVGIRSDISKETADWIFDSVGVAHPFCEHCP
jgi:VRR-NUC domain-containing protein